VQEQFAGPLAHWIWLHPNLSGGGVCVCVQILQCIMITHACLMK
jgi:hypothetical protein